MILYSKLRFNDLAYPVTSKVTASTYSLDIPHIPNLLAGQSLLPLYLDTP